MGRFAENEIISLVGPPPRYNLAESIGPDLRIAGLMGPGEFDHVPLAYGTAAGDQNLRRVIAEMHGVTAEDVVITVGGMHALFLLAFILCGRGGQAVTTTPCFPLARNALDAVGADARVVPLSFDHGYRVDPVMLREMLSVNAKLVSVASPQNPSGVAIPKTVLRDIVELLDRICPATYLLVDETLPRGDLRQ